MIEKKITIGQQEINVRITGENHLPIIVFLHGFTGSTSTWLEVMDALTGHYKMVAIDLTGHGKTASPTEIARYSMEAQLMDLEALFNELKLRTFTLVGYSMGGRIGLGYTINYPGKVERLILESASPGLQTVEERELRKIADHTLAERIQREGMREFVAFWESIPLFDSQKKMTTERQEKVREERLTQHPVGLSNSLKGIGTGSQPSYWDSLKDLTVPVLLITGEIDEKFVTISREMKELIPDVRTKTVKNVGHAIHVENPTLFATIVEEHIISTHNLRGQ